MTPHNAAEKGDYAEAVLLPGDPDRAEWIASTFLSNVRCVNRIRGALGFTGVYQGMPVSVQTTGMGHPSLSIYVHELLNVYGARSLIRVGTCGGLDARLPLRGLVLSQSASSDSGINRHVFGRFDYAPAADFGLLELASEIARAKGLAYAVGPTASSDVFYHPDGMERFATLRKHGVIAVDMETSSLYTLAAQFGARALSICTVVDNMATGEETCLSERQALFAEMARLALDVIATAPAPKA